MEDNNIIKFIKSKDFKKISDIGRGGTGQTILLEDETIDERFICKKYITNNPKDQPLYYEHFVEEIKILYKINHPNIVRVFNYYLYPKKMTGYILMEYIEGEDIKSYIHSFPYQINDVFIQTIEGFKYLEKKGILHRDIRPSNILVSRDGVVKIIDFGFGKNIQYSGDYKKSITLNWPYSWPNDIDMSIYDFKTEIYFLGKLFEYEISQNKLQNTFKYKNILDKMIVTDYQGRISSFDTILKTIKSETFSHIEFNDKDKQTYTNIANAFMDVCTYMPIGTKYIESIDLIINALDDLLKKSMLEEYIQDNSKFIRCFIKGNFRYNRKLTIKVSDLLSFTEWWNTLSNHNQSIVLNNLWTRFDTINRESLDDLPF